MRCRTWWGLMLVVLAVARCDNAGAGRVLAISTSGIVKGFIYLDRNGNGQVDGADTVLRQVRVRLIAVSTFDTAVSVVSDSSGAFRVAGVPIGVYTVAVDTTTIGDSVRVVRLSATQITVDPADSVTITATLSFPALSVRAARLLPAGRRVFLLGRIVSHRPSFGDTTGHMTDTSRAIRLTRMRAEPVAGIGDSVRLLGVTSTRDGQATLDDVQVFLLGMSGGTAPIVTTAIVARTAENGALDATLVFVGGAIIVDTATVVGTGSPPNQDRLLTVDETPADTAGRLEVLLDAHSGFTGPTLRPFLRDSMVDIAGVLIPVGAGRWRLKPRIVSDINIR